MVAKLKLHVQITEMELTVLRGVHHVKFLLHKAIIFCFNNFGYYIFHGMKCKNDFACV
jgi:hypothetical protein